MAIFSLSLSLGLKEKHETFVSGRQLFTDIVTRGSSQDMEEESRKSTDKLSDPGQTVPENPLYPEQLVSGVVNLFYSF